MSLEGIAVRELREIIESKPATLLPCSVIASISTLHITLLEIAALELKEFVVHGPQPCEKLRLDLTIECLRITNEEDSLL